MSTGHLIDCTLNCECCGDAFTARVNDHDLEAECPHCGSFDTVVTERSDIPDWSSCPTYTHYLENRQEGRNI